jgi:hypothetical protein
MTSGRNTKSARRKNTDLDAFQPSPPARKIDDKAATLEAEILGLKAEFRRERFVYTFIIATLFCLLVGVATSWWLFFFSVVAATVLLIAMAHWLDFPWVVANLQRWNDAMHTFFLKRANGKPEEVEPLPSPTEPPAANTLTTTGLPDETTPRAS